MYVRGKLIGHTDLIARVNVKTICSKHEVSFLKFHIDKRHADKTKIDLKKRYMVEDEFDRQCKVAKVALRSSCWCHFIVDT